MEYFNQNQFSNFRIHSALLVIKLPLNSILISENTLKGAILLPSHKNHGLYCITMRQQNERSDQFREVVNPTYLDILPQTVINLCVKEQLQFYV